MGEVPDWYGLIRSAKFLGVAPWELMDQPAVWQDWARMAQNAEAEAREQKRNSPSGRRAAGV